MAYIHIIDNINSHVSNCLSVCLFSMRYVLYYVGLLQTITIMKYQLWDIYNLDIYILKV